MNDELKTLEEAIDTIIKIKDLNRDIFYLDDLNKAKESLLTELKKLNISYNKSIIEFYFTIIYNSILTNKELFLIINEKLDGLKFKLVDVCEELRNKKSLKKTTFNPLKTL